MHYGPREGPSSFVNPTFTPIFLDEVNATVRQAAIDECGSVGAVACIYDFIATGSSAIASGSKATATGADQKEALSSK
jgi:hypothetical protein